MTGRKEDVAKAKREILSAAEHFSLIRASRKPSAGNGNGGNGNGNNGNGGGNGGISHLENGNGGCLNGGSNGSINGSIGGGQLTNGMINDSMNKNGSPPGPPANIPGQITIQVRVPYRVVGLVVGPKGATIKHIQQQTHTYIVTPSRDKEPVFEVTGLPDNVQSARRQIEAHIALRTGNSPSGNGGGSSADSLVSGSGVCGGGGLGSLLGEDAAPELLASLYKNGFSSLLNGYLDQDAGSRMMGGVGGGSLVLSCNGMDGLGGNGLLMSAGGGGVGVAASIASSSSAYNSALPSSTGSSSCDNSSSSDSSSSSSSSSSTSSKSAIITRPELINIWKSLGESIDLDEGLGDSPNIWSMSGSGSGPLGSTIGNGSANGSRNSPASPIDSLILNNGAAGIAAGKRECLVCGDKEVTAALVPCGHNMFCLDCANRICGAVGDGAACPICSQTVVQAIRIIA